MRRRTAALAGLTAVLIAVAGCGQKDDDAGIASANSKAKDKATSTGDKGGKAGKGDMVKFAKCMRDNGVDMPDPKDDEKGGIVMGRADGGDAQDMKKMEAAHKKCQSVLPPAPNGGKMSEKDKEEALKFAKCMRDNGVDMPDPTFEGSGAITQKMESGDPKKFDAALKKCGNGKGFSVPAVPAS